MSAQVTVLMRQAPYGTIYTAEGLRSIMGIAVFEMDITVVFIDDGVFALVRGQNPAKLDMKPLGEAFPALADMGVKRFYVHDESLAARGLTVGDLVLPVEIVSGAEVAGIQDSAGKVLPF